MNTAVVTHTPAQALIEYLDNRMPDFKSVSAVENPEKFARIMKNAILRDPEIAQATPKSVFLECQKACYDGVMLDGREAVLTRFKTNKRVKEGGQWRDNWVVEVAYIPMVQGIQKRVRNTGEIAAWAVEVVHQLDVEEGRFTYTRAPIAEIRHEPTVMGNPGPIVGAYSYVRFKDGSTSIEFMRRDQLEGIMQRTKSKRTDGSITGPWATDFEEMCRKTVIRRHSKYLPKASERVDVPDEIAGDITTRVDALYDMRADEYDTDPAPAPASVAKARKQSAAAVLKNAAKQRDSVAEGIDADAEEETVTVDGEIVTNGGEEAVVANPAGPAFDPDEEF